MEVFLRERYGRYYIFEKELLPGESVIVELPLIISKCFQYEMGISATDNKVSFCVTYSVYPESSQAVWVQLKQVSSYKAARAIMICNNSRKKQNVCMRIAF